MPKIRSLKSIAVVSATALAASTITLAAAGQAAAATWSSPQITSLAYTDSLAPEQSFTHPTGNLPLGSWADASGATHESRVYATFDLSSYTGTDVIGSTLYLAESQVTQCQVRSLEVWQTRAPTQPVTWHRAPDPETLLGTIAEPAYCPDTYMPLDLTAAVHHAVAEGKSTFSLMLQLPASEEENVAFGRWLANPGGIYLEVHSNIAPSVPTQLSNDGRPCATTGPYPYLAETTPLLRATFPDADPGTVTLRGEFAVWPLDNPDNRTVFTDQYVTGVGAMSVPNPLVNGKAYAWQARGDDGIDQSPWSAPCYFRIDSSIPTATPAVTSPNYPQNVASPGGVPAVFDIGANGVDDVAGFQYAWNDYPPAFGVGTDPFTQPGFVRADRLGGSATLTLFPPGDGPQTLYVRSITRSYNVSQVSTYTIFVRSTAPTLTPSTTSPQYGVPFTIHLTPNPAVQQVDSYTYTVDSGSPQTVTPAADGTATITVTFNQSNSNLFSVTSHSINGWVSSPGQFSVYIDTSPTITSDIYPEDGSPQGTGGGGVGVTGTFTFVSAIPNATSFVYQFDADPMVTVPAVNATAQVTYTPTTSGSHSLTVYSTAPGGQQSNTYYYYFTVN